MSYEPQRFTAPDGTEMVVVTAADYERLRGLAEEGEDVAAALASRARIEAGEGTMPAEVLSLILDEDLHPVAAWRRYRRLSQSALARKAKLSQVWISRIESGGGYGSRETRKKLAEALVAPAWALEEDEARDEGSTAPAKPTGRAGKYRPLCDFLRSSGQPRVTLSFDKIEDLVGKLPASAIDHRPWWGNHANHSQAKGWMDAGYSAEPDIPHRLVTFVQR